MAWNKQDVAPSGKYVMGAVTSGVSLNVFSGATDADVLAALQTYARGWEPLQVVWVPGTVLTIGESMRIFGRTAADTPTSAIQADMESAVNSFWMIAGASVSVSVSDTLTIPSTPAESFSSTVQWIAAAVIVMGAAWILFQLRKVTT